jgi:hypothetical protein
MTKKKAGKTQKSTLDTMPMTPPKLGGRTVPKGFIPYYNGTIEKEIEALKLVFRLDGSNPYKDDSNNINQFKPMSRYEEADYHTYLVTLHSDMAIVNKYVAIQNLMKHMSSTQHVWVRSDNIGSRYMYSTSLYEYLHQSETPLARTRRTGIEQPPRTTTERKDEEDSKQNAWISKTVKRAKDRDQRMTARSRLKQRLTKAPTPPSTNEMEISFGLEDEEEEEDTVMGERNDNDEIIEDEALSRLRRQEQDYLQEQEETKRDVLESTTGSTTGSNTGKTMEEIMEEIMERKIKTRIEQLEQKQEERIAQI